VGAPQLDELTEGEVPRAPRSSADSCGFHGGAYLLSCSIRHRGMHMARQQIEELVAALAEFDMRRSDPAQ